MNCHQILSGACNAGDRCFAIGSVEGIPFTVRMYTSHSFIVCLVVYAIHMFINFYIK